MKKNSYIQLLKKQANKRENNNYNYTTIQYLYEINAINY